MIDAFRMYMRAAVIGYAVLSIDILLSRLFVLSRPSFVANQYKSKSRHLGSCQVRFFIVSSGWKTGGLPFQGGSSSPSVTADFLVCERLRGSILDFYYWGFMKLHFSISVRFIIVFYLVFFLLKTHHLLSYERASRRNLSHPIPPPLFITFC